MKGAVYKSDALLLITAVIWGSAFVAQRVGLEYIGPFTFNAVRFALGALVLLPLAMRSPAPVSAGAGLPAAMKKRPHVLGALLAGLVLFLGSSLQQIGLLETTAGKAGFITGLYVIMVPLMLFCTGHRLRWGGWAGACLATAGLYLLSITDQFSLAPGDAWVLVGAVFWSFHTLILGWLSPRMSSIRLAAGQFAVCAVFSLAMAALREDILPSAILAAAWPVLYGGLLSVGLAFTLQVVAQKEAPPHHAAIILSLEAVFAALAGWLVLGETFTLRAVLGCSLMLIGMLISQLKS